MPCSALKLEFSFFFLDAGAVSAHSAVNWSVKIDKCDYFIQINEDNIPLLSLTGSVAGSVYSFKIYDTKYEDKCEISGKISALEMAKMELVRHSFKNSSGEVCFLDNLTLKTDSDGGVFSYYVWFSGVSFRVSCEPSASIPDKCGKSRAFAETVLLSDNAFKCDSLGGEFDGGVYPQKSPDGTDEYCVSGTCSNLCDSAWHRNVVKEIKDSVCCGRMRLEPQTGNGKCTEPKAMDSTKIGVHFPEVKLGCSVTPAGGGVNYCEVSSCSSSSSFDDAQSSSSYEASESSSSGEGEGDSGSDIECSADVGNALSKLHSKIRRCGQEGGVADFSEYSGCVYGSCLPPSSSSSEEMSSSSEEQSSSGDGESGVCPVDSQFLQKNEADLYDDWVYEGETLYGYDTVLVAVNPRSGFYDILGRLVGTELADLEKRVKGFYIYKNRQPRKIFDIKPKTMPMYRKNITNADGDTLRIYRIQNKFLGLLRDSTVYPNGEFELFGIDKDTIYYRNRNGILSYSYRNKEKQLLKRKIKEKDSVIAFYEYVWENGILKQEISHEGVRNYYYGNIPNDTVRVVPSDKGHLFHTGYDNTVGKIPMPSDLSYDEFAAEPYNSFSFNSNYLMKREQIIFGSNFLKKFNVLDFPNIVYNNAHPLDTLFCAIGEWFNCPTIFGWTDLNVIPNVRCQCDDGYVIVYNPQLTDQTINLVQSFYRYAKYPEDTFWHWQLLCMTIEDLDRTYKHELKHQTNAMEKIGELMKKFSETIFETLNDCESTLKEEMTSINKEYFEWQNIEALHKNKESPQATPKIGEFCYE